MPPDPEAGPDREISAEPAAPGSGASFRTTSLSVGRDGNVVTVRPSIGSLLFAVFFIAMPIPFILVAILLPPEPAPYLIVFRILFLVVPGGFLAVGCLLLGRCGRFRFDRGSGGLTCRNGYGILRRTERLADAAAIQVLFAGMQFGGSRPWPAFELNLVLAGGQRINLASHANGAWIARAGRQLAEFLDVPLVEHTGQDASGAQGKT